MLPLAKPRLIHFYVWWHKDKPVYVGQAADVEKRAKQHMRRRGLFGKFLRVHAKECSVEMLDSHVTDRPMGPRSVQVENAYIDYYGTMAPNGFNLQRADQKPPDMHSLAALAASKWYADHPGECVLPQWWKEHKKEGERLQRRNAKRLQDWRAANPDAVVRHAREMQPLAVAARSDWAKKNRSRLMAICSTAGKKGGRRTQELHPQTYKQNGKQLARWNAVWAAENPEAAFKQRSKAGQMADHALAGRHRAASTNHIRWHVRRGIKNQNCKLCIELS